MESRSVRRLLVLFCWSAFVWGVHHGAAAQEEEVAARAPVKPLVEAILHPALQYYDYYAVSDELAALGAEAVEPLLEHIHADNQIVQLRVLGTLSRIGPDSAPALNDLLILLRDRDPVIRTAAAKCIGNLGDAGQDALPDLMLALDDPDEIAVGTAGRAIATLDPEFVGTRLQDLLDRLGTPAYDVRLLPLRTWYRIACRRVDDSDLRRDLRQWFLVVHFTSRDRERIGDLLGVR